jgi:glutathione S-transferase
MAHPFARSTLFVSLRSPFARRVRIAFLEADVPFEERVENVFDPSPALIAVNPLARVPALRLPSGEVLVESTIILEHFWHGLGGDAARFVPTEPEQRLRADLFSGLATGLCDKSIEYYFETLRPAAQRDAELLSEVKDRAARVMTAAEAALLPGPFLFGKEPVAADRDLVIALTYYSLRVDREWRARFPRLAALQDRLEATPSFVKTAPPA